MAKRGEQSVRNLEVPQDSNRSLGFRKIAIRSYRSIVKADIKLGAITVIIGPSDSGKSCVVRALRDWAFNARGEDMLTVGTNVARVAVAISDRHTVVWEKRGEHDKHGGGSAYYLKDSESTKPPVKFVKIGHGVPTEISSVTGVREIEVDRRDELVRIQFAEQSDPWFLLANPPWTPGKITKVVGKVAGLDGLILANRALGMERVTEERELRRAQKEVLFHQEELGKFKGLDHALHLAAKAEIRVKAIQENTKRVTEARAILGRTKTRRIEVDRSKARAAALRPVVAKAQAMITTLEKKWTTIREAEDALFRAEVKGARLVTECARVAELRTRVTDVAAELKALAQSGEVECPLCGGGMHQECKKRLVKEAEG